MHVMDTDCEKIGGGCVTAESAPELAKPSDSPLLVNEDGRKTQVLNEEVSVVKEETLLVNGSSSDHPTTNNAAEEVDEEAANENSAEGEDGVGEEEEGVEASVADAENEMEVDASGTKETVEEDEEEEEEEMEADEEELLLEDNERQEEEVVPEEKEGVATTVAEGEEEEEEVEEEANGEVEDDSGEAEQPLSEIEAVELADENVTEQAKEVSQSSPIECEVIPPKTVEEPKEEVVCTAKDTNAKTESKPPSPVALLEALKVKELPKVDAVVIPVSVNQERPNEALSLKHSQKELEKRKLVREGGDKEGEGEVSSGSESDTSRKRIKTEPDLETTTSSHEPIPPNRHHDHPVQHLVDDDRERFIQEFISQCSHSVEEMDRATERLHKEVETLAELARSKELEWNAILRVRKMREEMLERLLRKRRLATDEYLDRSHMENSMHKNMNKYQGNNQLMMVPIVSSSPGQVMSHRGPPPARFADYGKQQRPILPKPYSNMVDPNCTTREGRNGPIVDVKSIIADYRYSSGYRSRHPESVPRRGRRMRGGPIIEPPPNRMTANPSLISMANMALGSGASIRTVSESPYNLSQDHSRPSSTDANRGGPPDTGVNMGYKDVLVQFAKLTNQAGVGGHVGKGPPNGVPQAPPPPYPEVTLHPVCRPGTSPPPVPPSSSLLHGILTKSSGLMGPAAPSAATRPPANFSPTLARLLTAPDRPPHPAQPPPHFRPQHPPRVSIADILSSSKKSRNEITITPVSGNPTAKPKEEVVLLQDDDETEVSDRLVIDESGENEEVPQCQGCRQKPAQFVCAGCGNQWYCSRECQVTAWEEHSDVCSG